MTAALGWYSWQTRHHQYPGRRSHSVAIRGWSRNTAVSAMSRTLLNAARPPRQIRLTVLDIAFCFPRSSACSCPRRWYASGSHPVPAKPRRCDHQTRRLYLWDLFCRARALGKPHGSVFQGYSRSPEEVVCTHRKLREGALRGRDVQTDRGALSEYGPDLFAPRLRSPGMPPTQRGQSAATLGAGPTAPARAAR